MSLAKVDKSHRQFQWREAGNVFVGDANCDVMLEESNLMRQYARRQLESESPALIHSRSIWPQYPGFQMNPHLWFPPKLNLWSPFEWLHLPVSQWIDLVPSKGLRSSLCCQNQQSFTPSSQWKVRIWQCMSALLPFSPAVVVHLNMSSIISFYHLCPLLFSGHISGHIVAPAIVKVEDKNSGATILLWSFYSFW